MPSSTDLRCFSCCFIFSIEPAQLPGIRVGQLLPVVTVSIKASEESEELPASSAANTCGCRVMSLFTNRSATSSIPIRFADPRLKHGLQQHITQFLAHVVTVVSLHRVDVFVGFLEQILEQRLVRLLAVPRAAAGEYSTSTTALTRSSAVAASATASISSSVRSLTANGRLKHGIPSCHSSCS